MPADMPESTPEQPKSAGQKLLAELRDDRDNYATSLLVERAAQTADWLERLDAIIDGREDEWLRLAKKPGETTLVVVVDAAMREARALSGELRHLLSDINRRRGVQPLVVHDDLAGL